MIEHYKNERGNMFLFFVGLIIITLLLVIIYQGKDIDTRIGQLQDRIHSLEEDVTSGMLTGTVGEQVTNSAQIKQ